MGMGRIKGMGRTGSLSQAPEDDEPELSDIITGDPSQPGPADVVVPKRPRRRGPLVLLGVLGIGALFFFLR